LNKTSNATIWDQFARLTREQGAEPPAKVARGATVLNTADYLPMVLPQLDEFMCETSEENGEHWRDFVGYGLQEDLERVTIPEVLSALQRFAANGLLDDGLAAAGAVMQLCMRELLRRGQLPALVALSNLPTEKPRLLPFPVIGGTSSSQV
jgi:hypothetical protein